MTSSTNQRFVVPSAVQQEYKALCKHLDIAAVPLIGAPPGSLARYRRKNGQFSVVVPSEREVEPVTFPPSKWEKFAKSDAVEDDFDPKTFSHSRADQWPIWRIELWHEVCHQVQHQIHGYFEPNDGKEGHAKCWDESFDYMAERFEGVTRDELKRLLD